MNEHDNGEGRQEAAGTEQIPLMQKVLDNPFILLLLGILVPTVFYIIWGIMQITQIPIAE